MIRYPLRFLTRTRLYHSISKEVLDISSTKQGRASIDPIPYPIDDVTHRSIRL